MIDWSSDCLIDWLIGYTYWERLFFIPLAQSFGFFDIWKEVEHTRRLGNNLGINSLPGKCAASDLPKSQHSSRVNFLPSFVSISYAKKRESERKTYTSNLKRPFTLNKCCTKQEGRHEWWSNRAQYPQQKVNKIPLRCDTCGTCTDLLHRVYFCNVQSKHLCFSHCVNSD